MAKAPSDVAVAVVETFAFSAAALSPDRVRRTLGITLSLTFYLFCLRGLDLGFRGTVAGHALVRASVWLAVRRRAGASPSPAPAPEPAPVPEPAPAPEPCPDVFYDVIEPPIQQTAKPKVKRCGHPTLRGTPCRNVTHLSGCRSCGLCSRHCECDE